MMWDTDVQENPTFPEVQPSRRKRLLSPSLRFRFPPHTEGFQAQAPVSVLKPRLLFQPKFQLRYRCHGN